MKNPKLITKPFAQNGQKNAIPENFSSSMESNQATWDQGFGQITMIPVAAGGLPPKGQDFNGIFNQISENVVYLSKGGRFKFSADYAAAINGYPKGAILQSDDEKKEYQSLVDNNKVNFNTATQAQINAAWKLFSTDDMLQQLAGKQPAGDYATKADLNNGLAGKQPAGDYATNAALNNGLALKFDKKGGDVESLTIFKKGLQYPSVVLKRSDGANVSLEAKPDESPIIAEIIKRDKDGVIENRISFPKKSGTAMLVGDFGIGSPIFLADLNLSKVVTQGIYMQQYSGSATVENGYPYSGAAGSMLVTPTANNHCLQEFKVFNDASKIYYRYILTNGTSGNVPWIYQYNSQNTIVDRNGCLKVITVSTELSDYPVGAPIPWPQTTPPAGFLACNGQSFNKATYPLLAKAYPSGKIDDLRAEFIRGLDAGRNVDSARAVLSAQGDAIRNFTGSAMVTSGYQLPLSEGVFTHESGFQGTEGQSGNGMRIKFNPSNVVPTANENRPRNIAFLYIVRAA